MIAFCICRTFICKVPARTTPVPFLSIVSFKESESVLDELDMHMFLYMLTMSAVQIHSVPRA
jgi:hypothetical protein